MIEYTVKVYDDRTEWFLNGKLHREDGPAIEHASGYKAWWLNDKIHREDGPAIEHADGTNAWFLNDKIHREDGPAIEHADGTNAWYLNGKQFTEDEFNARTNTQELTVAEISERLGYDIKVVK